MLYLIVHLRWLYCSQHAFSRPLLCPFSSSFSFHYCYYHHHHHPPPPPHPPQPGGPIPRMASVQAQPTIAGDLPVYRHPTDTFLPAVPLTQVVRRIRDDLEQALGRAGTGVCPLSNPWPSTPTLLLTVSTGHTVHFNHCLLQWYRGGLDYISEHADKTLDIRHGSVIANYSLGNIITRNK